MIRCCCCFLLLLLLSGGCDGGCAEVDSLTEAVAGQRFLLGCISCKRREEVSARATVDWYFRPQGGDEFTHIFHYEHPRAEILHERFSERLQWRGTKSSDVQTGAVFLHNVTFNDTGTFRCTFRRTLLLSGAPHRVTVDKEVELSVVAQANRELTAVVAEIMMFVVIVLLQLWLLLVLLYCYKKITAEQEARDERRALKEQALLLETKDVCDGVQLE